ncbi:type II toxin-antitoxin system HicA family toxin [Paraclostridium bifermentans]|uniref:type II toxin-antitoxin system HicA family toxin n=1 Tax=Paraclostridium bifermentans TaxID=1490 RepID=UPI00374E59D3
MRWDNYISFTRKLHNSLYANIDVKVTKHNLNLYLEYKRKAEFELGVLINLYLKEGSFSIYRSKLFETMLENLTAPYKKQFVKELRDCRTFEDYKAFVDTKGLEYAKEMFPKRDIKNIMEREHMPMFWEDITLFLSATIFPMYTTRRAMPVELWDLRDKELRYDYMNYGYPAFSLPVIELMDNEYFTINKHIEEHFEVTGEFPEEYELSETLHTILASTMVTEIITDAHRYDCLDRFYSLVSNVVDRVSFNIPKIIDNTIEQVVQKYSVEQNKNALLRDLKTIVNSGIPYEELMATIPKLDNIYLKYEDIIKDVCEVVFDNITILDIYDNSLLQLIKFPEIKGTGTSLRKAKECSGRLYEFRDFIYDYLTSSLLNVTLHSDLELNDKIKSIIESKYATVNDTDLEIDKRLEKETFKYLDKYRDLNNVATESGYTKVRQKGDHGIFKRTDGSTVIIPQGRNVGKGLSYKIQKDILS